MSLDEGPPLPVEAQTTEEEKARALADRIAQLIPDAPPRRAAGERPRVIALAGVPGTGKSTIQRQLFAVLGPDRFAFYDGDDDPTFHPRYDLLRQRYGVDSHDMACWGVDAVKIHEKAMNRLREGADKYDVLTSHPLVGEERARWWVNGFRSQDYRIAVVYVVTNEANSTLGLATRYQDGVDNEGGGHWVDVEVHDAFNQELSDVAQALESEGLVHDIYVVTREGYVVYENHRDEAGRWDHEPAVGRAIRTERDQPPTPEAHAFHLRTADRLLNGRDPTEPPLEPKVRATVELAVERENARPPAEPDPRGFGAEQRIDVRLQVVAPALADRQAWDVQRLASSGVAAPGASAPAADMAASGRSATAGGPGTDRFRGGSGPAWSY